jgi:hypothetical protein
MEIDNLAENDFVIIKTKVDDFDNKQEYQNIYTGVINYISNKAVGFKVAAKRNTLKNNNDDIILTNFSLYRCDIEDIIQH